MVAFVLGGGLGWLTGWLERRPERRVLRRDSLAGMRRIIVVAFHCSPQITVHRQGALPDEFQEQRNVEAVRELCAAHWKLWRVLWSRKPVPVLDLETALDHPGYRALGGRTEILRGLLTRSEGEYVSGDPRFWIYRSARDEGVAHLVGQLGADGVMVASTRYSLELEPLAQNPWWMAVATTSAQIVDRSGALVWSTERARGQSPRIPGVGGINLFFVELASLDPKRVDTMFTEAMARSWFALSRGLTEDLAGVAETLRSRTSAEP